MSLSDALNSTCSQSSSVTASWRKPCQSASIAALEQRSHAPPNPASNGLYASPPHASPPSTPGSNVVMSLIDGDQPAHASASSPLCQRLAAHTSVEIAAALANRAKHFFQLVRAMAREVPFREVEQRDRPGVARCGGSEVRREHGRGALSLGGSGDLDLEDIAFAEQLAVEERIARRDETICPFGAQEVERG